MPAFALKPGHPLANTILTDDETPARRGLPRRRCSRLGLAARRGRRRTPRVLAIHFATDVNPVTQDWLNHQLGRAESGGYAAAVIVLDTPGGLEESMRKIVSQELVA